MRVLKQWLDRRAITIATKVLPTPSPDLSRDEEALRIIHDPTFFCPPTDTPEVTMSGGRGFQFHSAVTTGIATNDTVHGLSWPVGNDAPTVILVHGWNAELHYLHGFPRLARSLNQRRLNVLAFELPYHLQRRPRKPAPMRDFISEHLAGMLVATRQAIADMTSLALWARARGSSRVALWGFSLGAWLAGLQITQNSSVDAATLTTPVSDLKVAIQTLPFCFPIRAALKHTPAPVERLNLTCGVPRPAPENILVTEGLYDQFVPARSYEELARAWHLSSWQQLPQSHISILLSHSSLTLAADWLAAHLLPGTS